ncbi:hypothetical protein XA68_11705 [Ophiocordyceps unilateralis]|uniref:RNA helicase n=1 Tax=Ophiocordyceps unilateralis TaxID=268505 RepID=A0A2A9PGE4_OPHUN|nr:hypothetical protein XA68_11705 [Ophiocordyceps unilateralis]
MNFRAPTWTRVAPPRLCRRRALSTTTHLQRKTVFRRVEGKLFKFDAKRPLKAEMKRREETKRREMAISKLEQVVEETYIRLFMELKTSPVMQQQFRRREFDRRIHRVNAAIEDCFLLYKNKIGLRQHNPLYHRLLYAFMYKNLDNEMRQIMMSSIFADRITSDVQANMKKLTDFTTPYDWFPATRTMQRTIHVHVGPTNSGKTYHALKALENSKSGVYAGPLRLLAVEVYDRLRNKGHACALITGEEVRIPDDTDRYFVSSTVEMVPLNQRFEVAVIDEIQMLSEKERGNSWTSAVLGVQAKEVHLCGEERTVDLIKNMVAYTGDKCVIHKYERLTPLRVSEAALGLSLKRLQKGDAIVAFSRSVLLGLRVKIEKATGRRCAIVYGGMPPEVRKRQAELFNTPDNGYDVIVASDAIGMGLNLAIKRVIFHTKNKYDGDRQRDLHPFEVKQIAGRAGRYRSSMPDSATSEDICGYVTTMNFEDLTHVRSSLNATAQPIRKAFIDAPVGVVERFASYYPPGTSLAFILLQIKSMCTMSPLYELNVGSEVLKIANILHDIPLSIADKMTFCYMPAALRIAGTRDMLRAMAKVVASGEGGDLLSMPEVPLEYLNEYAGDEAATNDYLERLESLHVILNQYVWLSYRYTGLFPSQKTALYVRDLVAERILATLDKRTFDPEEQKKKGEKRERRIARLREKRATQVKQRKRFFPDGEDEELGMAKTQAEAEADLDLAIEAAADAWMEGQRTAGEEEEASLRNDEEPVVVPGDDEAWEEEDDGDDDDDDDKLGVRAEEESMAAQARADIISAGKGVDGHGQGESDSLEEIIRGFRKVEAPAGRPKGKRPMARPKPKPPIGKRKSKSKASSKR